MSFASLPVDSWVPSTKSNDNMQAQKEQQGRKTFLLFVHILFRLLKKSGDELLLEQAKLAVIQYRYKASTPLQQALLVEELQDLVGSEVLAQAKRYMAMYRKKKASDAQVKALIQTISLSLVAQDTIPRRSMIEASQRESAFRCNTRLAEL